jgi:hypothetical protein
MFHIKEEEKNREPYSKVFYIDDMIEITENLELQHV